MIVVSFYPDIDNNYILHQDSFLMLAMQEENNKPLKALIQYLNVHGLLRNQLYFISLAQKAWPERQNNFF